MFKVYATGQSFGVGAPDLVELESTPAVEGCGGEMLIADELTAILLPAGTYTVRAHAGFTGPDLDDTFVQIDASDDADTFSTGPVGSGATIDTALTFTFSEAGVVTLTAGPGSGASGVELATSTYAQVLCGDGSTACCPRQVGDATVADPTLSLDGTVLFDMHSSDYRRHAWPSMTLIDTIAWTDLGLAAPFDAFVSALSGPGNIVQAGDGYLYIWIYNNASGDVGLLQCLPDGSSASVVYATSAVGNATGLITWHPADPDALWAAYEDRVADTAYLIRFDLATFTRTDVLTLPSGIAFALGFQQYEAGLIVARGTPHDVLVAYDIVTASSDTYSAPSVAGFGTAWDGLILWTDGGGQALPVEVQVNGSVQLVEGEKDCPSAWFGEGFYWGPIAWFAPEDRSHVYVSDLSRTWDFTCGGHGWIIGRVGFPA